MIENLKLKYDNPKSGSYYLDIADFVSGYFLGDTDGFANPRHRVDVKERGNANGSVLGSRLYGQRSLKIAGELIGTDASDYETLRRNIQEACALHNGLKDMIITTRSGLEVTADYIVENLELPYQKGNVIRGNYDISIICPYPFFKSTTDKSEEVLHFGSFGGVVPSVIPFAMSSGGGSAVNCENEGNVYAYPIFTIHGEVENPSILNDKTGESLSLNYTIPSGKTVEIDVFNRTVKLNTGENLLDYLTVSDDEFWVVLEVGDNNIKFTGTNPSGSAKVVVDYNDSYLGI